MPVTKVKAPDGTIVKVQHPEGASQDEIIAYAKANYSPPKQEEPVSDGFSFGNMVRNIPDSAYNYGKNIVEGITHPVQTLDAVRGLIHGGTQKLTDMMPQLPGDTSRMDPGLLAALESDNRPIAEAFGQSVKDRYGSVDAALNTLENDPVGLLADAATVTAPVTKGLLNPVSMPRNVARTVASKLTPKSLPARMYERTAKFSTTLDDAQRANMVETALRYGIKPTAKGVGKLDDIIKSFNNKIDDLIRQADASGKTLPRQTVFRHIDDLKKEAGGFKIDAPGDVKGIQRIVDDFEEYAKQAGLPDRVTASDLQKFKVDVYQKINWDARRMTGTPVRENTLKTVGRGAREGVEELVPGVKPQNAELGNLYELQPHLARVANRLDNRNMVQLEAPIQVTAGAGVGHMVAGEPGAKLGGTLGGLLAAAGHHKVSPALAIMLRRLQEQSAIDNLVRQGPMAIGLLGAGQADRLNDLQSR